MLTGRPSTRSGQRLCPRPPRPEPETDDGSKRRRVTASSTPSAGDAPEGHGVATGSEGGVLSYRGELLLKPAEKWTRENHFDAELRNNLINEHSLPGPLSNATRREQSRHPLQEHVDENTKAESRVHLESADSLAPAPSVVRTTTEVSQAGGTVSWETRMHSAAIAELRKEEPRLEVEGLRATNMSQGLLQSSQRMAIDAKSLALQTAKTRLSVGARVAASGDSNSLVLTESIPRTIANAKSGSTVTMNNTTPDAWEVTSHSESRAADYNNEDPLEDEALVPATQPDVLAGRKANAGTGVTAADETTATAGVHTESEVTSDPETEVTTGPDGDVFVVERVADGEGQCITMGRMDGQYTAPWPSLQEQAARAREFTIADNDIVLIGYPKSGTHWLWEILHMLLRGQAEPTNLTKERLMFSFSTQEFFDLLAPPRVFNTHSTFTSLPRCLQGGLVASKTIFLLRNPKDVAVSYYHFLLKTEDFQYKGNWNGFFRLFMEGKVPCGSWFDYILDWERHLAENPDFPVLLVYYEDLKRDCAREIKRIADYLGLVHRKDLCKAIADACAFNRMKQHALGLDKMTANGNIGEIIYRKGIVGDWKNWFSQEQNKEFHELYTSKMASSAHRFTYDTDDV